MDKFKRPIITIGHLYGDYYASEDLTIEGFRKRFADQPFLRGLLIPDDGKLPIVPGTEESFHNFLREGIETGLVKVVRAGGGARNSRFALDKFGVSGWHYDSCSTPDFETELSSEEYYAGTSLPAKSLIIESGDGKTLATKTERTDKDVPLSEESEKKLRLLLSKGYDVFVNSLSNNHIAEIVSNDFNAGLYLVVTKSLPREEYLINRLVSRSNGVFFGASDFYWFTEQEEKFQDLFQEDFDEDVAKEMTGDIHNFRSERNIDFPVVVTVGSYGAIGCEDETYPRGLWVYLDEEKRQQVSEHLSKTGKSTNSSGDTFAAIASDSIRNRNTLEFSLRHGSQFVVKNKFGFPISHNDYSCKEFV